MIKYFLLIMMLLSTPAFAGYKVTGNLEVTGNIGIGTATPRAKIDVDGPIYGTVFHGDGSKLTGVSSQDIYWTGTATNLNAATGRTSLGLGTAATTAATDYLAAGGTSVATASDSTWTTHNSYPSACGDNQYVKAIGDTLTCVTIDGTVYASVASLSGYVPTSRTVNGKALSSNITLNVQGDIDAGIYALDTDLTVYALATSLSSYVPTTRTINGKALSSNVTLTVQDVDASIYALDTDLAVYVTGATANKGLVKTGASYGTLGLIETCGANEILKFIGGNWVCSSDATAAAGATSAGGDFNTIQYNTAGVLGGIDGFVYDGTDLSSTRPFGINNTSPVAGVHIGNASSSWSDAVNGEDDLFVKGDAEIDGALYVDGYLYGNGSKLTGITGGTTVHSALSNLSYATAGHTGFVPDTRTVNSKALSGNITLTAQDIDMSIYVLDTDGALYQAGDAGLTSLAGLAYTSPGFVRQTASDTFTVDTTIYALYSTFTGLTANRFPRATGTGLVDGSIYQNSTGYIGVAATAPVVQIQVDGSVYVGSGTAPTWTDDITITGRDLFVKGSIETDGTIYTDSTGDTLLNYTGGNVGIGTTQLRQKLTIDGAIYSINLTADSAHGAAKTLCLGVDGIIYGITNGNCH